MDVNKYARDYIALGSWAFLILVAARAAIGPFWLFLTPLLVSAVLCLVLEWWRGFDGYVLKASVIVILTSWFYQELFFTLFALASLVVLTFASRHLNATWKDIFTEAVLGVCIAAISQYAFFLLG